MEEKRIRDFRIKVRVVNNQIRERREAMGMSQAALAKFAGTSIGTITQYETFALDPINKLKTGGLWKQSAWKLATALGALPEELWPKSMTILKERIFERRIDAEQISTLVGSRVSETPLLTAETHVDASNLPKAIDDILATVTAREAEVLRYRFGLGGNTEHTLDEAAEIFDVPRERVRQIEAKALRKLRHPSRYRHLMGYMPSRRAALKSLNKIERDNRLNSEWWRKQESEARRKNRIEKDKHAKRGYVLYMPKYGYYSYYDPKHSTAFFTDNPRWGAAALFMDEAEYWYDVPQILKLCRKGRAHVRLVQGRAFSSLDASHFVEIVGVLKVVPTPERVRLRS